MAMNRALFPRKVSRRALLVRAGVAVLGLPLVQACGAAAQPTATTAPAAPAQAPAKAPEPAKPAAAAAPATGAARTKVTHGSWSTPVKVQPELYNQRQEKVDVVFEVSPWDGYTDKMILGLAAGTAPDMFEVPSPYWRQMMRKKITLPLDDLIKSANLDPNGWNTPLERSVQLEGKTWALPWLGPAGFRLIYNQRIFDEAGAKYPTKDATWDDITQAALAIHKPPDRFAMRAVTNTEQYIPEMIRSNGGRIFSEDGTKVVVDSPEAIEAVQTAVDWLSKHKVAMAPGEEKVLGTVAFQSDKLAIDTIPGHDWEIWNRRIMGLKGKTWLMPTLSISPKTKKHVPQAELHMRVLAGKTKVVDQSWEYLKWLQTSDEGVRSQFVQVGYMPTYHLKEQLASLDETRQKFYLEMMDFFKDMEVTDWGPKGDETQKAFATEYQLALLGKKPVAQAMKDAQKAMNDTLMN
jgi:ABC-type glycerol-3-phosphate transport system substrate-binding protein